MRMIGAIEASLAVDKSAFIVGEFPTFAIIGARPGSQVLWTSWQNGEAKEYEASHGEVIGANGTAELAHPAFTTDDVGYWEKQIIIKGDDGSRQLAQVFFTVNPVAAVPAGPAPATMPGAGAGFFDQTINLFGAQIPTWLALGAGALLLYKFTKR